jgi:aspartate-semialdehyde dehydrogenase
MVKMHFVVASLIAILAVAHGFAPVASPRLRSASALSFTAASRRAPLWGQVPARSPRSLTIADAIRMVSLPANTPLKVGICGATGAVGKEIIGVLEKRGFPVKELHLFGSERSAGRKVPTKWGDIAIEDFSVEKASKLDVVFVSVSGDFSKQYCDSIAAGGAVVIDNSSAFRYEPDVCLCVPEINAEAARSSKRKVIANPNCTTAIGLMALYPLHKKYGIKKVIMSTYQAASGAGAEGMAELFNGVKEVVNGPEGTVAKNQVFAHPLPFNLIPHIDVFQENLYTKEEMKVTWEARKIMDVPNLPVSCTAVRIPTLRAHAEAITIETEKPIDVAGARAVLAAAPGVRLSDDPAKKLYPMPLTASTAYPVEVGRVRNSVVFGDHGLDFFVCGDQLLRGAALNAVLVAEAISQPVGSTFAPAL